MASVEPNSLINNLSGAIGNLVLVRRKGKLYVRRRPSVNPDRTERQLEQQEHFKVATGYATNVLADAQSRQSYELAAKSCSATAQNLAVGDFLKTPVIREIDPSGYVGRPGDSIVIDADDDFEVVEVRVVIRDRERAVLEEGAAVRVDRTWVYSVSKEVAAGEIVTIEATAIDRPQHAGAKSILYEIRGK
ncbi:MAG: hypothetical protein AB9869_30445 [Verrucomicrobiia bacterium]